MTWRFEADSNAFCQAGVAQETGAVLSSAGHYNPSQEYDNLIRRTPQKNPTWQYCGSSCDTLQGPSPAVDNSVPPLHRWHPIIFIDSWFQHVSVCLRRHLPGCPAEKGVGVAEVCGTARRSEIPRTCLSQSHTRPAQATAESSREPGQGILGRSTAVRFVQPSSPRLGKLTAG